MGIVLHDQQYRIVRLQIVTIVLDLLDRTLRICHRLPHSQPVGALMFKFLLDYFTRLCPNTALKQT